MIPVVPLFIFAVPTRLFMPVCELGKHSTVAAAEMENELSIKISAT
jgi:hypothetical protein